MDIQIYLFYYPLLINCNNHIQNLVYIFFQNYYVCNDILWVYRSYRKYWPDIAAAIAEGRYEFYIKLVGNTPLEIAEFV